MLPIMCWNFSSIAKFNALAISRRLILCSQVPAFQMGQRQTNVHVFTSHTRRKNNNMNNSRPARNNLSHERSHAVKRFSLSLSSSYFPNNLKYYHNLFIILNWHELIYGTARPQHNAKHVGVGFAVFSLSRRGSVIDARKSSSTLDPPGHCALNCQGTFRN